MITSMTGFIFSVSAWAESTDQIPDNVPYGMVAEPQMACLDFAPAWPTAAITTSSSSLTEGSLVHGPKSTLDGSHQSTWCEGVSGHGEGEWIELQFPQSVPIEAMYLSGGYFLDERRLTSNSRLKRIRIDLDDKAPIVVSFADPAVAPTDWTPPSNQPDYTWINAIQDNPGFIHLQSGGQRLRITVLEVYPGGSYQDTCISEMRFVGVDSECADSLE